MDQKLPSYEMYQVSATGKNQDIQAYPPSQTTKSILLQSLKEDSKDNSFLVKTILLSPKDTGKIY